MQFVFVIEPGFTMQAFSSAIEVLRLARKLGADLGYRVASLEGHTVTASNGIAVVTDCASDAMSRGAVQVVVSGAGAVDHPNPELISHIRNARRNGHPLWGMSSGVVRLAQAGLLDGCTVAAHWEDIPYLRATHPRVDVTTSLFVLKGPHPTCSGGGASADLMLSYLATEHASGMVEDIASRLMLDGVRDGRMRQAMPAQMRFATSNATVFASLRLMEANLYDPIPVGEIARRAGVSQRQLERLFQAEYGTTPARAYADLRLGEARQEVIAGHRPIIEIALDYGFSSGTFTKAYQRAFGLTPSADRAGPEEQMS